MSNLELCVDEYKLIQATSEKYFDYMYRTLNLYLLFLSAVLVFGLSQDSQLVFSAIFCYLIPVFSMIFGLLFCYNSCALAKIGYIGIVQERTMRKLCKSENQQCNMAGWITFAKQFHGGWYILSYGTILMLYFLIPLASICYALFFNGMVNIGINHLFANIFLSILPFLFYLIYLVFMLFIISSILQNVRWTSQELREIEEEIEAGDCSWPWSQHFLAAKSTQDKKKKHFWR